MKKELLILAFFAFPLTSLFSQGITKSADGESTILFRGSSITADLGETELNLSFNNLQKSLGKENLLVYGGSLKGQNKSGLAGLFNKGDFVPSSNLNGFIGWSTSNGIPNAYQKSYTEKLAIYEKFFEKSDKELHEAFNNIINLETKELNDKGKLKQELYDIFDNITFGQFINKLENLDKDNEDEKRVINKIIFKCKILYKNWKHEISNYEAEIKRIEENINNTSYKQFSIFLFGGINSLSFKRYLGTNLDALNKSFQSTFFRGGEIGLGANFQYKNWMFGTSYAYSKTNNFNLLTKKEYTIKTISNQSTGNSTLTEEKKITAYSGTYGEVEVNEFNIDVIYRAPLDKKEEKHILINPYLKSQLLSRNEQILPNVLDIGCGFYFYDNTGKFLAGFYVELPDVENNYEKVKPVENQNLRDPIKRLSLGIVTKMSLSSVLNFF
ncbi:hypothetical protein [uncultured Tenacibaculum sp.]|uniref:hypothetical protein n=1 Tax=uncultured Tenacibaculum sp. TaxID=174713 RepID=UPI00262FE496|nr:hypothetical protein [uncultured Tenacibaculum sp.]